MECYDGEVFLTCHVCRAGYQPPEWASSAAKRPSERITFTQCSPGLYTNLFSCCSVLGQLAQ